MRRNSWVAGVVAGAMAFGSVALADTTVLKTENTELKIGAMTQVAGYGEIVKDPYRNDERVYLFMKEARFRLAGSHDRLTLNLELGLGPEDKVLAPSPGLTLGLLDLNADVRLDQAGTTYLKIGQMKVPYGREQLTYSGDLLFADRSIENLGFVVGRDVGVAVVSKPGPFTLIGGVYTGGGRNVPLRFLPEIIGVPMAVARIGVGNIEENPFEVVSGSRGAQKLEWGVSVNGLFTRDSLVGHSTVLNVKTADKSLLLNGNWNPYIAQKPLDQGKWYQAGVDAVVRAPIGAYTLAGEAQVDYATFANKYGDLNLSGGRLQGSVARGPVEVTARYAMLISDPEFKSGETIITGKETIHEVTPSITYNFGNYMRVVADLPVLLNTPVITEEKVGSYIGTDMPDQTSLLAKGGTVAPQNVVQGRLMFQARF